MEWEEKRDPIEDDPAFFEVLQTVNQEAQEKAFAELQAYFKEREIEVEIDETNFPMGTCFKFWRFKKQILKERYGIDWQSPQELNPDVWYD